MNGQRKPGPAQSSARQAIAMPPTAGQPPTGKKTPAPQDKWSQKLQGAIRHPATGNGGPLSSKQLQPAPVKPPPQRPADPVEAAVQAAVLKLRQAQTVGQSEVHVGSYPMQQLSRTGIGLLDKIADAIAGKKFRYYFDDPGANAIIRWMLDNGHKWERRGEKIIVQCLARGRPKNHLSR